MIALLPYARQKGVSPVGVRAVVRYAHNTLGSSSDHITFAPSNWVFIILRKDRFVALT